MATFKIHQDSEKENGIAANANKDRVKSFQNNKRPTFAILKNVANNGVSNVISGKTAFRDVKTNSNENDENFGEKQRNAAKKATFVPLEQFKTFSVYEDNNSLSLSSSSHEDNKGALDISDGAIRNPLCDISHRGDSINHETPMSVSGVLSPMSIDKSQLDSECKENDLSHLAVMPRNDRERFFEIIEYQQCILEYFRESEKKHRPKPNYMKRQPDINYSMRTILVDWLVEVAEEYRLDTETLYLAVSYIDRFLSYMSVVRAKLQLVGTAAMYIAAKYEEIYPPDVGEFVFITDDTYTKTQVLRMEQIILKILSFDLCVPTNYVFINTYAVLHRMHDQVKFLALFLSELSLLEADPYLQYYPSQVTSAALALSRYLLDMPIWCSELEEITTYSLDSLKEIIVHLCRSHNASVDLGQQAIQEKYKSSKYLEVSTIKPVNLSSDDFDLILSDYNELKKAEAEKAATSQFHATSNESVRKMISSLMFV